MARSIRSAALSPDEKLMLAGDNSGRVWLWDIETGKLLHKLKHRHVNSVAFSPDGVHGLSAGNGKKTLVLWNLQTGKLVRVFHGHNSRDVYCSRFSPDGNRFLSCGSDGTLRMWDVATGKEIWSVTGFPDTLTCIDMSLDGKFAVTSGGGGRPSNPDFSVRLWNLQTVLKKPK